MKIERLSDGVVTTIRMIGHFQSGHLEELEKQLQGSGQQFVLDLREITLVDVEVVRFLGGCKAAGVKIVNSPQYVREWMDRERESHCRTGENERESS